MSRIKALVACKAARTITVLSVAAGVALMTAQTALATTVPSITETAPPGADEFEKFLGYGMWAAAAACFAGVLAYVAQMVTAHTFGRSAVEHNGKLAACLGGAVLLGICGSLLNGLM